jgi:hypothetical protein
MTLKRWLCSLMLASVSIAPVFPETNSAAESKNGPAAVASSAEASPNPNPAPSPTPSPSPSPSVSLAATDANVTALLGVLVMKGVLAPTEANAIQNAAPAAQFQALIEALSRKGVLNAADLSAAAKPATPPAAVAAAAVPAPENETMSSSLTAAEASPQPQTQPGPGQPIPSRVAGELAPPPVAVVTAVTPVRVFPVDPPKSGGLAGIKAGPITLAPYGFIKATIVHDSSDPDGDDFPFPGIWLNAGGNSTFNTGPTEDPEVHVKARSTRFGMNFEWPDISPKLTLTGKIEGDFEGNFTEVDNADVSSIRNNQPRLRLAYARVDYHASDTTDLFFVGGQDWTLFGSGALMNIVETTFNGAFWGNIYTRSPQLRVGFIQTLEKERHVNLEGQFGVMMPSTGQILKLGTVGLAGQLGQGEREGADADRPEYEGRVALSYQIDKARGVAPAQIAFAGFHSMRTSIVPNSSYLCDGGTNVLACSLESAFPNGFQASSTQWGGQFVAQLPTRWFTLTATAYKGGDLRFYLGGQLDSYATDTGGLTATSGPYVTADGGPLAAAGGAVLGCTAALVAGACPSGDAVVAPQRPIRAFGGFVQLGLPLSRWFNADPKGHNAGWQLHLTVGKDQVVDRDLNNPGFSGTLPMLMGKSAIATLYYKLNNWATFGFEQSIYATRGVDHSLLYTIAGIPSNEWQDHRTEFGPIFTF